MVGFVEVRKMFFDSDRIRKLLDKKTRAVLSKGGAYIRRTAQSSIRKSKRKSEGELSAKERKVYQIRCAQAKREGRPKPKRPLAPSKPGEPPRTPDGTYKRTIFFFYDESSNSMVAGPVKWAKSKELIPAILESGGTESVSDGRTISIKPRPHMRPAYEKNANKIVSLYAGDL